MTLPPLGQEPGRVSDFISHSLHPDQALQVDCGDLPPAGEFLSITDPLPENVAGGFLVILSTQPLDVTALYLSSSGSATGAFGANPNPVEAMNALQVPERVLYPALASCRDVRRE